MSDPNRAEAESLVRNSPIRRLLRRLGRRAEPGRITSLGTRGAMPVVRDAEPSTLNQYRSDLSWVGVSRGCEPRCRHRCPSCRMGLVSHLVCDPKCEVAREG